MTKTTRVNDIPQTEVTYTYDLSNPTLYNSKSNRLMMAETRDMVTVGHPVTSTSWYTYTKSGNVERIITKEGGGNGQQQNAMGGGGGGGNCSLDSCKYSAIRFGYAGNAQAVTHVVGESWCWDGESACNAPNGGTTNYKVNWGREFRYDGARARYMDRKLSTIDLNVEAPPDPPTNGQTVWTDYDGDEAYSELISKGDAGYTEPGSSHQPGAWRRLKTGTSTFTVDYLHGDMLGTLRQTTNTSGTGSGSDVFTAFGERISGSADRHGYVGAHGYQSTLDSGAEVFPFLHLGHRYYDPSSGRFLQRDPIGMEGGLNVYTYRLSRATVLIDPTGLWVSLGKSLAKGFGATVCAIFGWAVGSLLGPLGGVGGGALGAQLGADLAEDIYENPGMFGELDPDYPSPPNRPRPPGSGGDSNCCLHGENCPGHRYGG